MTPVARIAANLRATRTARGLTVVDLAARSGVARATLTTLESGQGNPTIDTVYALANALGVSLSDLIADPPTPHTHVLRAGQGTRIEGSVSARLLDRVPTHHLSELYEIGFGPLRTADPHPPGTVESLLVTAGHLRVGPVDTPHELGPGDFIRFPGDVPHLYEALDGSASGVLMVTSH